MGVRAWLTTVTGVVLHTEKFGASTHLITEDHARVNTQYKSATHTTAATTALVEPRSGAAIVVTDVTVTGEKITGGVITVQFTDGVNTDSISINQVSDGPVNLHIGYVGRRRGWKDARIDFITSTNNQDAAVTVGYYHLIGAGVLAFEDWDALR